jgi:hypothetical protein
MGMGEIIYFLHAIVSVKVSSLLTSLFSVGTFHFLKLPVLLRSLINETEKIIF